VLLYQTSAQKMGKTWDFCWSPQLLSKGVVRLWEKTALLVLLWSIETTPH
jgi:hypothetical protein